MKQILCKNIIVCLVSSAVFACSVLLPAPLSAEGLSPSMPLEPSQRTGINALAESQQASQIVSANGEELVYDRELFTEDVTWRGAVLIKGYVAVSPQATLRIEAGTIVRFAAADDKKDVARLVVQGRLQAVGTVEKPIIFTSDRPKPARGDWGGISLISTEKRNTMEQCRIEYAISAIEAGFSTVNLKNVLVAHTNSGILARDSVVQMSGGNVTESETGIEIHDSEFELRDVGISACKYGIVMQRSAVVLSSSKISKNELYGILSEDCRIKITSAEISENGAGTRIKGGEGQIMATRFSANHETALHLSGARIKIQRCHFSDNRRDALHLEDGRSLVSGNAFSGNKGFNLYNAGSEDIIALQNWWGSYDRPTIIEKIYIAERDPHSGKVQVFPWLTEMPPLPP